METYTEPMIIEEKEKFTLKPVRQPAHTAQKEQRNSGIGLPHPSHDAARSLGSDYYHLSRKAQGTCSGEGDKSCWVDPAEVSVSSSSAGSRGHRERSLLNPGSSGSSPGTGSSKGKASEERGRRSAQSASNWRSEVEPAYSQEVEAITPERRRDQAEVRKLSRLGEQGSPQSSLPERRPHHLYRWEPSFIKGKAKKSVCTRGSEQCTEHELTTGRYKTIPSRWRLEEESQRGHTAVTGIPKPTCLELYPCSPTESSERGLYRNSYEDLNPSVTPGECELMQWESNNNIPECAPMDCTLCMSDDVESLR